MSTAGAPSLTPSYGGSSDGSMYTGYYNAPSDSATRANKRWKAALAEYQAPTIDAGIDEALRDFIGRRKSAMTDQWY